MKKLASAESKQSEARAELDESTATFRKRFGHSRQASDSSNAPSAYTLESGLDCRLEGLSLHKVQTVENLHQLGGYLGRSERRPWNSPADEVPEGRPSDLFPYSEELNPKSTCCPSLSLRGTANTLSNDMDATALADENRRLRAENRELRLKLERLRDSADCGAAEALRQQRDRLHSQREELRRGLDRVSRELGRQERAASQLAREKELYQEISEKLNARVSLLLEENCELKAALHKAAECPLELRLLQDQYERVRADFAKLERLVREDDEDWEVHKQMWVHEREYYKEIIRKLEFQIDHTVR